MNQNNYKLSKKKGIFNDPLEISSTISIFIHCQKKKTMHSISVYCYCNAYAYAKICAPFRLFFLCYRNKSIDRKHYPEKGNIPIRICQEIQPFSIPHSLQCVQSLSLLTTSVTIVIFICVVIKIVIIVV